MSDKQVFNLSTRVTKDKIPFPKKALLDLDTLCIFASATEKTQRPFISRCLEYHDYIKDENHFRNILKKLIVEILLMSDKQKSELLLDYVEQIVPKYTSLDGEIPNLHSGLTFHNSKNYYYLDGDMSKSIQPSPELAYNTLYFKQAEKYSKPEELIEYFIQYRN